METGFPEAGPGFPGPGLGFEINIKLDGVGLPHIGTPLLEKPQQAPVKIHGKSYFDSGIVITAAPCNFPARRSARASLAFSKG